MELSLLSLFIHQFMTLTQLASDNILTQKKGAFLCLQALPPPHNVVNNESVRVDPEKMLLREIALDKSSQSYSAISATLFQTDIGLVRNEILNDNRIPWRIVGLIAFTNNRNYGCPKPSSSLTFKSFSRKSCTEQITLPLTNKTIFSLIWCHSSLNLFQYDEIFQLNKS